MDQTIIKPAVQHLIRGGFSMLVDEVRGHYRRKNAPQGPDAITIDEITPYPALDQVPLGQSIAPGEEDRLGEDAPVDLFAPVVGMEHEIKVLRRCVVSEPPLHALIIGQPGLGKSVILEELRRLPDSRYIVGRNMTSSGLIEMFIDSDEPPRILLIDEIEKSDPTTLATLLTVMDGKATRAMHGKAAVEREVDVRIIAAGNNEDKVPDALADRFIILRLQPYSESERRAVIEGFLVRRHGVAPEVAAEIAGLVAERGGGTRDAYQIAQIWRSDQELAREMVSRLGPIRASTAPKPHGNRTETAPVAAAKAK